MNYTIIFMSERKKYDDKRYDDKRYISRGKFYVLHLNSEIISKGVKQLNENKVGAPFVYSDVYL